MKYRQGKYEQPIFSLKLRNKCRKKWFNKSSEQQNDGQSFLSCAAFSELSDHGRESAAEPGRPAHRRSAVGLVTSCHAVWLQWETALETQRTPAASVRFSCFIECQLLQCMPSASVNAGCFCACQLLQCMTAASVHISFFSLCQLLQYMTAASVHTSFFSAASCFSSASCTGPRSCSTICQLHRCTYASGFGNSSCASSGPIFSLHHSYKPRSQWPSTAVRPLSQLPMFTLCVTGLCSGWTAYQLWKK